MLRVVVVRGAELGAHAPVVARDDDGAAARGLLGVDAVLDPEAGLLDRVVQDGGVLVVADAAEVDDGVGREEVLRAAGSVLRGAAGDELGVVVVQQVLVDALVLLLGQNGVVGLEAVFLEEGIVAEGLDVWCGQRLVGRYKGQLDGFEVEARVLLTEEGVLQAEETVLFGGSHLVCWMSSRWCLGKMSKDLAGLLIFR